MNKIKSILAFAALMLCGGAWAATPVAVWDGDLDVLNKDGYTLNLNGNTGTKDAITIGSKGIKVTIPGNGFENYMGSIIVQYSGVTAYPSATKALATFDSNRGQDYTGVCVRNTGDVYGVLTGSDWDSVSNVSSGKIPLTEGSHRLGFVVEMTKSNVKRRGTHACIDGTSVYSVGGLVGSETIVTGFCIGGEDKTTLGSLENMVIEKIAVFNDALTNDEVTNFRFPSETTYYTATVSADTTWANLTWNDSQTWGNDYSCDATISVTTDAKLTIGTAVTAKKVTFDIAEGKTLTLAGQSGVKITAADNVYVVGKGTVRFDDSTGGFYAVGGSSVKLDLAAESTMEMYRANTWNYSGCNFTGVSGAGTIKLSGTNWQCLPGSGAIWPLTHPVVNNLTTGGMILSQGNNAVYTFSNFSGNGLVSPQNGSTGSYYRSMKIVQSDNTEWSGNLLNDASLKRFTKLTVAGAEGASEKTLTFSGNNGDYQSNLEVEQSGSLKLTGTWRGKGAVTINGEFGGTGSLTTDANGDHVMTAVNIGARAMIRADWGAVTLGIAPTMGKLVDVVADEIPESNIIKLFSGAFSASDTTTHARIFVGENVYYGTVSIESDGVYATVSDEATTAAMDAAAKYKYEMDGSFANSASSGVSLTLGKGASFAEGDFRDSQILKLNSNVGSHWGSAGFAYGLGAWTIVTAVKAPAANNCVFGVGGAKTVAGMLGLRNAGSNTMKLFTANATDLCGVTLDVDPTAAFHVYSIVYEDGKIKMNVDGGAFCEAVPFTPGTGTGWQMGGIVSGGNNNHSVNATSGEMDCFRMYSFPFVKADTQTVAAEFIGKAAIGDVKYFDLTTALKAAKSGQTVTLLADCAENVTIPANVTIDPGSYAFSGTVSGAGTIISYGSASAVPAVPSGVTANTWTGTVWLKNKSDWTNINLDSYGNSKSTVRLTGITGHLTQYADVSVNVELRDEANGDTTTVAFKITNGWSNNIVVFQHLKGDGTLDLSAGPVKLLVKDWELFTGVAKVSGTGYAGLIFGNVAKNTLTVGNDSVYDKKITILANNTVTIPDYKTWSATSGIVVYGTIKGQGTLGSNTVLNDGATFDVTDGVLTLAENKSLTIPSVIKVQNGEIGGLFLKTSADPNVSATVEILSAEGNVVGFGAAQYNSEKGGLIIGESPTVLTISENTTLDAVTASGKNQIFVGASSKITGSGELTVSSITCAANKTLTIGAGVTLKFTDGTIQIPDGLVLEAGAKISGTAVPDLAGQTIKIADAANLQPGAYPVLEWTAGMGLGKNGYGVPSLDLQGVENDRVRLVCLVGKVYLQVLDPQLSTKKQYRIWAVGDSITEGYNGTGNGANYRTQLAAKLSLAGYNVKMVGQNTLRSQMPSGEAAPDEWAWHSGVSAQRIWTQNAFGSDNGRAGYMEAIDAAMFQVGEVDVITLLLGTNDLNDNSGGGKDTAEHAFEGWKKLVKKLLAHYPNAKIIVSSVIDMHSVPEKVADYRQYLETSLTDGTFGDDAGRIYNAKLYDYVIGDTTNGMFEDGFHPTWNGHDKMSDGWYKAITNAIDKVAAAETPAEPVMPQLGAANNIPAKYTKLFKRNRTLDIGKKVSYALNESPTYGNVSGDSTANVTKIGYYLELVRKTTKDIRYVWVDMNIPQGKTFEQMLVPTGATLAQKVTGLHVYSNMGSIADVDPNDNSVEGYIEFTPFTATSGSVSGAPAQLWGCMDWNDTLPSSGDVGGRGSMQIHRIHQKGTTSWNSAETLFAWNNWGAANAESLTHVDARNGEIGIGNFAQHYMTDTTTADKLCPAIGAQINAKFGAGTVGLNGNSISSDYTSTRFSPWGDTMNAEAYEVRNLEIWTYDPTALPEALLNGNETTFVEAVAEAQAGDTIDVLKDVAATNVALDKDITIGTVNGIDVSVAVNFTGAHKLTKVGVGTLTLTGSNQFNAIDIQEGAVEMTSASAIAAGATLAGSGRVIFNGFLPVDNNGKNPTITIGPSWTGTVEMKSYSHATNANIIYFEKFANANSTVALNGVTATTFTGKNNHDDQEFGKLEIMEGGWTTTTGTYSIDPKYTCNLIGSGTIDVKQGGTGTINFIGDHSKFAGTIKITAGSKGVILSPAGSSKVTNKAANTITIAEGAVVGASGTWTASAGIVVNGELTFVSQPTITGTITGSGRLGFAKFSHVPSGVKTNLQSTTGWTGSLVINGGTTDDGTVDGNAYTRLNEFGNVNSKIELADTMTGYFGLTTKNAGDDPAARIIKPEIVVSGTWSQDSGYSQRDNSKNYCTIIRKLSGSGHINGAGGASQLYYIIDGSEFTGKLTAKAPKFVFGTRVDNSLITDGSVTVFDTGIISSQMTIDSNNAVALNGVVSLPEGATLTDGTTIYSYKGTLNVGETARAAVAGVVDSRFTVKGANDNHDAVLEAVAEDTPIVVPVVPESGVMVEPGAEVKVPTATEPEKIKVVYNGVDLAKADAETSRPKYVNVTINNTTGAVELDTTAAAKPTVTSMAATTENESDVVSFTITPIPGLFYSVVAADGPSDSDFAEVQTTGTQATTGDETTLKADVDLTGQKKVKYFRVRVKATK